MTTFKPMNGLFALVLAMSQLVCSQLVLADKTILVIESYHAEHPWDKSYLQGLKESVGPPYSIFTFAMDTKRLPESEHAKQAQKAWQNFRQVNPDLVVLGDDNALKYLGKKVSETGTPVVYLGVNSDPNDLGLHGQANMTGILERPLFNRSVALMNRIMYGDLASVLVLFDNSATSKAVFEQGFDNGLGFSVGSTKVNLRFIAKWQDWQRVVLHDAAKYDAVMLGLYHAVTDEHNQHVAASEVLAWTSEQSTKPLFAFWDFSVGKNKAAGGLVSSGYWHGFEAGEVAKRVFAGEPIASIQPRIAKQGRFVFSKSELQRWGISLPDYLAERATFVD